MAYLLKTLLDVKVELEQLLNYLLVNLSILIIHLLLSCKVKVLREVLGVPEVILHLLQRYPLHGIGLQHAVDEVLDASAEVVRYKILTLLYLTE